MLLLLGALLLLLLLGDALHSTLGLPLGGLALLHSLRGTLLLALGRELLLLLLLVGGHLRACKGSKEQGRELEPRRLCSCLAASSRQLFSWGMEAAGRSLQTQPHQQQPSPRRFPAW